LTGVPTPLASGSPGVFVEPAGLRGLDRVADAESLEGFADRVERATVKVLEADVVGGTDLLAQFALCEAYERAVHSLGAHRLCAQARAEVLAAPSEGADADQVEADLDRLDDLKGLEHADATVVEGGVGQPVLGRQGLAAGLLECLHVEVFLSDAVAQDGKERF